MTRLTRLAPADLQQDQRALYSSIVDGPRAQGVQHFALTAADGSLLGPFNALLLSPALGGALQALGAAVRYETHLPPRVREMAILMVAARWDSDFERSAHESVGRAVGLSEQELAEIAAGGVPQLPDPTESACAHVAHALVRGDLSDEEWGRWAPRTGERAVFELSTLVGYYATLALQLRVFRVGVGEGGGDR